MSKRIGFIGVGKLGQACAEIMAETYNVTGYDVHPRTPSNFSMSSTLAGAVKDKDIVFIAVQTSHDPEYDGSTPTSHLPVKDFDYSTVKQVLKEVNEHATPNQLIVLISTVLPGTTRREFAPIVTNARFLYNPYLIAMGTVKWDMVNPEMVMIGTEDGSATGSALELKEFYDTILENSPRYVIGTWEEIESTKVCYNTFISAKVGLVNMIQDIAERIGHMNAELVCDALAQSTRRIMGPAYMKPGMSDGGACVLPGFAVKVNGKRITMEELYNTFDKEQSYIVDSANYTLTDRDQKKINCVTSRDYVGDIFVFETADGQILRCTPDHLLPVLRNGKRVLLKADDVEKTDKLYIL